MADVTISALGALTPIVDSIILPASTSNGSSTGKVTIANINSLAPVQSVAARTGAVTLTKADVGLGNVTNDAQLKIASNLSDLNNTATARTNIGLGSVENKSSATIRSEIVTANLPVGTVLQVQSASRSAIYSNTTNTSSWTDIPGISVSITTTGANNKVKIESVINGSTGNCHSGLRLVRTSSTGSVSYLGVGAATETRTAATCGGFFNLNNEAVVTSNILFIDTPGSIGTYTYKVQVICPQGCTVSINSSVSNVNNPYCMVTGASVITLTEIAG
jgi:hypothetical protein